MSKQIYFKCDRCGKIFPFEPFKLNTILLGRQNPEERDIIDNEQEFVVCASCMTDIKHFINSNRELF